MTARAEPLIESAYKALLNLGAPYDAALALLDLAEILRLEARWHRLSKLTDELFDCLPTEADQQIVGELRRLAEACRMQSLSAQLIAAVRKALESHLAARPTVRAHRP